MQYTAPPFLMMPEPVRCQKALAKAKESFKVQPKPQPSINRNVRRFSIQYEAKGYNATQRFLIPSTEIYAAFLTRMAEASAAIANFFILGRTTGFTKDDGAWRYSLVDQKGREQQGEALTSNILYQAMISELLKVTKEWKYALIWHVSSVPTASYFYKAGLINIRV